MANRPTIDTVACLWCGARVRLRRDGRVALHAPGKPTTRAGISACVGSRKARLSERK